jgi:hypothetical protein
LKTKYFLHLYFYFLIIFIFLLSCNSFVLISEDEFYHRKKNKHENSASTSSTNTSSETTVPEAVPEASSGTVSGTVNCIYLDESNSIIYVGTSSGLYKANKTSMNFSKITYSTYLNSSVTAVYANGTSIYAGTSGWFTFSNDGGTTWNLSTALSASSITGISVANSTVYVSVAGGDSNGIYLSSIPVTASSFTAISSPLGSGINSTGVYTNSSGYIFAIAPNYIGGIVFLRGTTTAMKAISGLKGLYCYGSNIYMISGTTKIFYYSTNNFSTYSQRTLTYTFTEISGSAGRVFCLDSGGGYYYSDDLGATWNGPYSSGKIYTKIFATSGNTIYLASGTTIYKVQ